MTLEFVDDERRTISVISDQYLPIPQIGARVDILISIDYAAHKGWATSIVAFVVGSVEYLYEGNQALVTIVVHERF